MIAKWIIRFFGSMGFVGYLPFMPGTFGSLLGAGASWFLIVRNHLGWDIYLLVCAAVAAVAFYFGEKGEKAFGASDPKQFVMDEVLGQMITFLMVPLSLKALVLGFLYFRFFDIIKPYPVAESQRIEGGAGINIDDLIAGLYACVSLHITVMLYHIVMGYLSK